MQNEYYYLSALEQNIEDFLQKETLDDNEFGWVPENIARRMAEAAFAVLRSNKELNDYLDKEGLIKD